jgi:hypothetical protein
MSLRRVFLACAAALALGACEDIGYGPPPAPPPVPVRRAEDPRPLRVLFVGNSLTFFNDLPARTAEKAGLDTALRGPDLHMVVRPGYSLRQHWALGEARQRITSERWDYVVLQEGSGTIVQDPDTAAAYVARFDSLARAHGARTVLFLTWSYGERPLASQDTVTQAYLAMAARTQALVAPVGIAWQRIRQLRPDLTLYLPDSIHPGPVGTYLAACTFVAALYRRTPEGLAGLVAVGDTNVVFLDSATVTLLASTAWDVTVPYLPALPDVRGAAIRSDSGPAGPRTAHAATRP